MLSFVYVAQVLARNIKFSEELNPEWLASVVDMDYINQISAEDRLGQWCEIVLEVKKRKQQCEA